MRVESQLPTHFGLSGGGAVKGEDEVVAFIVGCLVFYGWSGEVEDAPVCKITDCGVAGQEEGGGCAGDAMEIVWLALVLGNWLLQGVVLGEDESRSHEPWYVVA